MERVIWKSNIDENITPPNCPRCGCSNTKFCYYNNYSLTQPRYFCKGCRRYWTKGGSLRNVPVGGGAPKARRGPHKSRRSLHETATKGGNSGYASASATSDSNYGHNINGNGGNISNNFLAGDGSHIDLALVYANFLSQKPEIISKVSDIDSNINIIDVPEILGSDDQSFGHACCNLEFPNYPNFRSVIDHHDYDQNHDEQIFLCGLDSFNKQCQERGHQEKYSASHDFGKLPPLPGQEAMLWSNSYDHEMMVSTDQASRVVPPVVGPEVHHHHHHHHQEDNLFSTGNCWSPFDLPRDDHDIDR